MKSEVLYTELLSSLKIGKPAVIIPKNHTSPLVSNNSPTRTSVVVAIFNGGFETQNSIYKLVS